MSNQGKQEVSVETKPQAVEKKAAEMFMKPYEEFERFIERMLGQSWRKPFKWGVPAWDELMGSTEIRLPSIDMIDRDDHILVRAEIPGIDKDDLSVSINENVLTIKGETKREEKKENGDYFRHEISRSACARSITLPVNVYASKVNATLTNGILEVTLGKVDAAKRQNIKVN